MSAEGAEMNQRISMTEKHQEKGASATARLAADQLCGQTLRGYRVEELIGIGSTTAVYRLHAEEEHTRPQALSMTVFVLPSTLSRMGRERFLSRFVRIAAVLVELDHPHLFPIYGYGEQWGHAYLLMPDVQGASLASLLREQGPISLPLALAIIERIAEGLEYVHRHGLVHRSLAPTRVFLHDSLLVQVAGTGLLHLLEGQGIETSSEPYAHLRSITGAFLGEPAYLAPEIVAGQDASVRSDVYALGTLLFELLSGHVPFEGTAYLDTALMHGRCPVPPLHTICPHIPLSLEMVIAQALKPDPAQRFPTPPDFAQACQRVMLQESSLGASTLWPTEQQQQSNSGQRCVPLSSALSAMRATLYVDLPLQVTTQPPHFLRLPVTLSQAALGEGNHTASPSREETTSRRTEARLPAHPLSTKQAAHVHRGTEETLEPLFDTDGQLMPRPPWEEARARSRQDMTRMASRMSLFFEKLRTEAGIAFPGGTSSQQGFWSPQEERR
jgi:serine/threonine protein kinase